MYVWTSLAFDAIRDDMSRLHLLGKINEGGVPGLTIHQADPQLFYVPSILGVVVPKFQKKKSAASKYAYHLAA